MTPPEGVRRCPGYQQQSAAKHIVRHVQLLLWKYSSQLFLHFGFQALIVVVILTTVWVVRCWTSVLSGETLVLLLVLMLHMFTHFASSIDQIILF